MEGRNRLMVKRCEAARPGVLPQWHRLYSVKITAQGRPRHTSAHAVRQLVVQGGTAYFFLQKEAVRIRSN